MESLPSSSQTYPRNDRMLYYKTAVWRKLDQPLFRKNRAQTPQSQTIGFYSDVEKLNFYFHLDKKKNFFECQTVRIETSLCLCMNLKVISSENRLQKTVKHCVLWSQRWRWHEDQFSKSMSNAAEEDGLITTDEIINQAVIFCCHFGRKRSKIRPRQTICFY